MDKLTIESKNILPLHLTATNHLVFIKQLEDMHSAKYEEVVIARESIPELIAFLQKLQ